MIHAYRRYYELVERQMPAAMSLRYYDAAYADASHAQPIAAAAAAMLPLRLAAMIAARHAYFACYACHAAYTGIAVAPNTACLPIYACRHDMPLC